MKTCSFGYLPRVSVFNLFIETMSAGQSVAAAALDASRRSLVKTYERRVRESASIMLDSMDKIAEMAKITVGNEYGHVPKLARAELDAGEMSVRVGNLVRAAQQLLRITSELRQLAVLSDLPAAAAEMTETTATCRKKEQEISSRIETVKQEIANELFILEEEYFTSPVQ